MPTARTKIINGKALRQARLRSGMTLRDLSQRCDSLGCKVDASNIHKAELRDEGIGVRKLPTLARALGVEVDKLLKAAA
jgi:transcriptional regulator with XRE-family HTH domain